MNEDLSLAERFSMLPLARRLGIIALLLLVVLVPAAVFMMSGGKSGLEKAAESLNEAIAAKNKEEIARLVDYKTLASGLALSILSARGDSLAGEKALTDEISETLEHLFDQNHGGGGGGHEKAAEPELPPGLDPEKVAPDATPELRKQIIKALIKNYQEKQGKKKVEGPLDKPIQPAPRPGVLPENFVEQLIVKPFMVVAQQGSYGVIATTITNIESGYETPLQLALQSEKDGWRVKEVANVPEIMARYNMVLQQWQDGARRAFYEENARRRQLINAHYRVESCEAFLAKNLGADSDVPLVITVNGRNMGLRDLMSAGMHCNLIRRNGSVVATVPLNTARQTPSGHAFHQRWQIELPAELEETRLLMAEPELRCQVNVVSVTLDDGRLLYEASERELQELLNR